MVGKNTENEWDALGRCVERGDWKPMTPQSRLNYHMQRLRGGGDWGLPLRSVLSFLPSHESLTLSGLIAAHVRLHFPVSPPGRQGHVTKLWPAWQKWNCSVYLQANFSRAGDTAFFSPSLFSCLEHWCRVCSSADVQDHGNDMLGTAEQRTGWGPCPQWPWRDAGMLVSLHERQIFLYCNC